MPINTNFDYDAYIVDGHLKVTGTTDPVPAGYMLLFRHFTIQQEATTVTRVAQKDANWEATSPIPVGDFEPGSALAMGTETYLFAGAPFKPAAYETVVWSQIVTIKVPDPAPQPVALGARGD